MSKYTISRMQQLAGILKEAEEVYINPKTGQERNLETEKPFTVEWNDVKNIKGPQPNIYQPYWKNMSWTFTESDLLQSNPESRIIRMMDKALETGWIMRYEILGFNRRATASPGGVIEPNTPVDKNNPPRGINIAILTVLPPSEVNTLYQGSLPPGDPERKTYWSNPRSKPLSPLKSPFKSTKEQ